MDGIRDQCWYVSLRRNRVERNRDESTDIRWLVVLSVDGDPKQRSRIRTRANAYISTSTLKHKSEEDMVYPLEFDFTERQNGGVN